MLCIVRSKAGLIDRWVCHSCSPGDKDVASIKFQCKVSQINYGKSHLYTTSETKRWCHWDLIHVVYGLQFFSHHWFSQLVQPVWFYIKGFLPCQSVWELSRKSSSVFSDQRKFLLCLIRPTCRGSRHRLHFSHFNPSSSHCSSNSPPPASLSNHLQYISLPGGPSHPPLPLPNSLWTQFSFWDQR